MFPYDLLQSIASINTVPLLILVFLLYFLRANWRYEVKQTAQFMPPTLFLMILMVISNIDYYISDIKEPNPSLDVVRRLVAMLGYDVRIILMSLLIAIVSDRLSPRKHTKFWTVAPAVANSIVLLPCLFTDLYFSYNEHGEIIRGPLAFEPHILAGLYVIFVFVLARMTYQKGRRTETGILSITAISVVIAVLVEMVFGVKGVLLSVISLSILGYYLYAHIEHFRYDNLTKILNREAFNVDVEKFSGGNISHVLSIDLNDLKKLNDTYGHNEGDKALVAIASALETAKLPKTSVYRIGGDEFAAICFGKTTNEVEKMIEHMYEAVESAGYSCAIGFAEWQKDKTFTEIYKDADDNMYRTKRAMKGLDLDPMRVK